MNRHKRGKLNFLTSFLPLGLFCGFFCSLVGFLRFFYEKNKILSSLSWLLVWEQAVFAKGKEWISIFNPSLFNDQEGKFIAKNLLT